MNADRFPELPDGYQYKMTRMIGDIYLMQIRRRVWGRLTRRVVYVFIDPPKDQETVEEKIVEAARRVRRKFDKHYQSLRDARTMDGYAYVADVDRRVAVALATQKQVEGKGPVVVGHQPRRGDDVDAWLKSWRDSFDDVAYPRARRAIDGMLDEYRERADYGIPLSEPMEGRGDASHTGL